MKIKKLVIQPYGAAFIDDRGKIGFLNETAAITLEGVLSGKCDIEIAHGMCQWK